MYVLSDGASCFCSSKSKIPVWPFVVLSFFGGAYALIPYFVLWKPPPPPVEESQLGRWPLNFLESKLTAGVRRFLFWQNSFNLLHCQSSLVKMSKKIANNFGMKKGCDIVGKF